jgi:hypothetical protein
MTQDAETRDTERMKAILVVAATLAFVFSPLYSGGFGGFPAELFPVPQEDPPVQPAGYAFAIWSVIYLWLVASAGYGLVKRAEDPGWDATRWPLVVSLVAGAPWIAVAMANAILATVLIWVMLIAALFALRAAVRAGDLWWLAAPLGLYAGWLTAASAVSIGLLLGGYGVTGEIAAAWIALVLALVVALGVLGRMPVLTYGAAVVWALVAVAVQNAGSAWILALAAGIGAAGIAVLTWLVARPGATGAR